MSWKKAKKETDLEEGPFGPRLVGKERVGADIEAKGANYLIYIAPQPWVIDFDDYSFKRCHLCLGVRQKNFRPINMHIACRMQEKLCFSGVLFRKRVITSGFLRVKG